MPPPIPAPPTVLALKEEFLSTQTRLLKQPVAPSQEWRASAAAAAAKEDETATVQGLPEKAIDDALFRLNNRLRQHTNRVYPLQATKHVAEQIDQLYWNAASAVIDGSSAEDEDRDGEDGEVEDEGVKALRVGADLVDPKLIAALPPTWDPDNPTTRSKIPPGEEEQEEALTRYSSLVTTLQSLSTQKQELAARVSRLRRMRSLLRPFSPPDSSSAAAAASSNTGGETTPQIQDNLVTRNGEIEKELQRMRMLLARVGGRVDQLDSKGKKQKKRKRAGGGGDGDGDGDNSSHENDDADEDGVLDMDVQGRRRVEALLRVFGS